MEASKVGYWLQIGANVGILLGLVFVGFQIQQDRDLKVAELLSSMFSDRQQVLVASLGEEPHKVIVKAALEPDALTPEEKFIYTQYLEARATQFLRFNSLESLELAPNDWQLTMGVPQEARTKIGAQYFRGVASYLPPTIRQRLEDQLETQGIQTEFGQYLVGEDVTVYEESSK